MPAVIKNSPARDMQLLYQKVTVNAAGLSTMRSSVWISPISLRTLPCSATALAEANYRNAVSSAITPAYPSI
nr:hypothetical protein [Providencia rettgeri]